MVKFPVADTGNLTLEYFERIYNFQEKCMAIKNGKVRKKGFDFIIEFLAYLAGIIIFAIAVIVTYTAVVRYLGFRPPIWVLQWTEYGLLWFTFLGAAWLLREGGHIRIDTIITRLHTKRRHKVEIIDDILGFIVSAIIFWFGTLHAIDLYQRGIMEVKGTIVPKFPIFIIIPLGGLALSIQFGRQFFNKIRSKPGHEDK